MSNTPGPAIQEKPKVHQVIAALCCNEEAKKLNRLVDLTNEMRSVVDEFFKGLDDKAIDDAFDPPAGSSDILKSLLSALASLIKSVVKVAKDQVSGLIPRFVLPITFCPKLPCPSPGECTIKGVKKFTLDIQKAALKDPFKKFLKDFYKKKVGSDLPDWMETVLDTLYKLNPLRVRIVFRADVDLAYDCAKDCFTRSKVTVYVGLQFSMELSNPMKELLDLIDLNLSIGFGANNNIDVGEGNLTPKMEFGGGDVDEKTGESSPLTFKVKWGSDAPKDLQGTYDIFKEAGWSEKDRKQSFKIFEKEQTLESLKWVKKC
jgi:hypothetical protein